MPVGGVIFGHKRRREEPFNEGRGGSAGSITRGLGGAGGNNVFECTICGKACSKLAT